MNNNKSVIFDLFGLLFLLTHRFETVSNEVLKKDDLTVKQWFLLVTIDNFFINPPAIHEVARELHTSHQNVKQIVNSLLKKGFVKLQRDEKDKRILRIILTEKNKQYWASREEEHGKFILSLFKDLTVDEINHMHRITNKLLTNFKD